VCILVATHSIALAVCAQKRFHTCYSMQSAVVAIQISFAGAFSEGMALTEKSDLKQDVLLDVLSKGAMANPMFALKGPGMMNGNFPPAFPLKHQQKDMRLACSLGYVQLTCTQSHLSERL
jgi:NAD-binding of NADP-dependent 3-hydroxyisobutyrate dehydrogenase